MEFAAFAEVLRSELAVEVGTDGDGAGFAAGGETGVEEGAFFAFWEAAALGFRCWAHARGAFAFQAGFLDFGVCHVGDV